MNHDATHCNDYTPDCPKTCYRASLTIDLEARWTEFIHVPISWANFKGTSECMRGENHE